MLYLVATPIGNLADISYRAIATLKKCDYILCEDTRYSKRLLDAYEIDRPLRSYHKFNERERLESILADLREGKEIALISDAGTPGICDPGMRLAAACIEENLYFTTIPGPNAALTALSLSGLSTERFQFLGFLPKGQGQLTKLFEQIFDYPGTTIVYETPHRLAKTLSLLHKINPKRRIVIARELTKLHEQCLRGTVENLLPIVQATPPRGEIVLLIEGKREEDTPQEEWPDIPEHVELLQKEFNLSLADAIKRAAKMRGVPKREIYRVVHGIDEKN